MSSHLMSWKPRSADICTKHMVDNKVCWSSLMAKPCEGHKDYLQHNRYVLTCKTESRSVNLRPVLTRRD
jgi:hypothetical protein